MVEQQVAVDRRVLGARELEDVAGEAEAGGERGVQPRVVRLRHVGDDQRVGALGPDVAEAELQVADLVAAEGEAGGVVALDEEARRVRAERLAQPGHVLQRGRQVRQVHARQCGDALGETLAAHGLRGNRLGHRCFLLRAEWPASGTGGVRCRAGVGGRRLRAGG